MIYNLNKKDIEKVLIPSLIKALFAVVLLNIINVIVSIIKSMPVESVRFSSGYFYLNDEPVGFSFWASFNMFLISLVLFCAYGVYKTKKENRKIE